MNFKSKHLESFIVYSVPNIMVSEIVRSVLEHQTVKNYLENAEIFNDDTKQYFCSGDIALPLNTQCNLKVNERNALREVIISDIVLTFTGALTLSCNMNKKRMSKVTIGKHFHIMKIICVCERNVYPDLQLLTDVWGIISRK